MFACRGAKSVTSLIHYYHLAGSVQVTTNLRQNSIWTLRNSGIISGSQVSDRRANNAFNFCVLQEELVKRNECKNVRCLWTASRLGFFSWMCTDRNTNDRLNSPKSGFSLCTQTCFLHSTNNLLSSALFKSSEQKHTNWTNREPFKKALLSKNSHGNSEKPEPEENKNKIQQLKKVFKEYGAVGVTFHIGISLISLGIFYAAVSSGVNMVAVLCKLGFSESVVQSKMATGTSTFVLAYAVHKLFAPFRISITLVSVPLIVRYLRKTGLFKSLPPQL